MQSLQPFRLLLLRHRQREDVAACGWFDARIYPDLEAFVLWRGGPLWTWIWFILSPPERALHRGHVLDYVFEFDQVVRIIRDLSNAIGQFG